MITVEWGVVSVEVCREGEEYWWCSWEEMGGLIGKGVINLLIMFSLFSKPSDWGGVGSGGTETHGRKTAKHMRCPDVYD